MEKSFPKVVAFSVVPGGSEGNEWTVLGPVVFSPEGEMTVPFAEEGVIELKGSTAAEEKKFFAMLSSGEVFFAAEGSA